MTFVTLSAMQISQNHVNNAFRKYIFDCELRACNTKLVFISEFHFITNKETVMQTSVVEGGGLFCGRSFQHDSMI